MVVACGAAPYGCRHSGLGVVPLLADVGLVGCVGTVPYRYRPSGMCGCRSLWIRAQWVVWVPVLTDMGPVGCVGSAPSGYRPGGVCACQSLWMRVQQVVVHHLFCGGKQKCFIVGEISKHARESIHVKVSSKSNAIDASFRREMVG